MNPQTPTRMTALLLLLSTPGVVFFLVLQTLPIDRFTSRTWEALALGSNRNAPFLPLQSLEKLEKGDLALHHPGAMIQKVHFETDELGYRNTPPACPDPYAVVIGDSMAVGGALSQEETPAAQLSRALGKCVRSFAGGSFAYALNSVYGLGFRPKQVILIQTQRSVGGLRALPDPSSPGWGAHRLPALQSLHRSYLEIRKNLYWNFRAKHGVVESLARVFRAPVAPESEVPPHPGAPILFYPGDQDRRVTDSEMDSDLRHLDQLAAALEPLGARLVYAYVPNKSTIYPGAPADQDPDFIDRFLPRARAHRARFIDLFHPYREDWRRGVMNHHLEDTHWNAHGVARFVEQVAKKLIEEAPRE
jgi:hypothetical protein